MKQSLTTSIVSIKSKWLQDSLGVTTPKSAKRKLLKYGCTLIDDEFFSLQQMEDITARKLRDNTALNGDAPSTLPPGSSFSDLA